MINGEHAWYAWHLSTIAISMLEISALKILTLEFSLLEIWTMVITIRKICKLVIFIRKNPNIGDLNRWISDGRDLYVGGLQDETLTLKTFTLEILTMEISSLGHVNTGMYLNAEALSLKRWYFKLQRLLYRRSQRRGRNTSRHWRIHFPCGGGISALSHPPPRTPHPEAIVPIVERVVLLSSLQSHPSITLRNHKLRTHPYPPPPVNHLATRQFCAILPFLVPLIMPCPSMCYCTVLKRYTLWKQHWCVTMFTVVKKIQIFRYAADLKLPVSKYSERYNLIIFRQWSISKFVRASNLLYSYVSENPPGPVKCTLLKVLIPAWPAST